MRIINILINCTIILSIAVSLDAQIISLNTQNVTIRHVLDEIEQQSGYKFFYIDEQVDVNRMVSVSLNEVSIEEALSTLFNNGEIRYKVFDKKLVVLSPNIVLKNRVTGTIMDAETGEPLYGVNILVEATTTGVTSDREGRYSVECDPQADLTFSYVGYESLTLPVNKRNVIEAKLSKNVEFLNEVIVVGYGSSRKRNITSSVATFETGNLEERPITRVDEVIIGQMSGVLVKQTTGTPGKAYSIVIRGTGSLSAGNEPLYVIDGFPLATASMNGSGNFATGNPLDNLNPNDIESIQVLKDASASAIYGSRAANGVVLINTRQGKLGKTRITLDVHTGITEATRKLDMLNAEEWIDRAEEMINAQWIASAPGRTASQTTDERRAILGLAEGLYNTNYMIDDRWNMDGHPGLVYLDWQDVVLRRGNLQNYQLSATGGAETVKYYISGNYSTQEGIVKYTDYTNFSARVNVEASAIRKLKIGLNLAPTYSVTNDPGVEGKDAIWHQALTFTPVQEASAGIYANSFDYGQYKWGNSRISPIAQLENIIGQNKRFRTLTTIFGDYEIIKGLLLRSTINFDYTDNASKAYYPYSVTVTSLTNRQIANNTGTSGYYMGYKKQTFVNENILSYNKKLMDIHNLSLMAGVSYNSDYLTTYQLNSNGGYNIGGPSTLNEAAGWTGNSYETKNVLLSYFGRVQYSYFDKYLFSASLRKDGSSRFGANAKWATFPSASFAWRVSNETFMKHLPVLSEFKLRFSWGTAGNYNIGDFSSIATLSTYGYAFGNTKAIGRAVSSSVNPDITWEESETFDGGIDIGILKNRIYCSADYYHKLNKGLLLYVPIPAVTGFTTTLSNAGKVRNEGWEFELMSRNLTGRLEWTTTANLTYNTNKVKALGPGQTQIWVPSTYDISHSILKIGEQINSISVVRQIGILSQEDIDAGVPLFGTETAGDPKYEDQLTLDTDGDGIADKTDGVIDANDRVIVGHQCPDYVWGLTNTFRYKGFDLSVFVQGQKGGVIYSLLGRALNRTGQGYIDNYLGLARTRWRSPEDPGNGRQGKAYSTFGRIKNTDWLYSSDYWRIRNITLGYDIGKLIKIKEITGARIYITAENWFGKDKYYGGCNPEAINTDISGSTTYPEAGDYGGLPLSRSFILGLNLNF